MHRRVGIAAGTIAASVAAALVVPTALGGGSTAVIDPAGEPSSSTTARTSPTSAPVERPDGWWNMPAVDMVSAVQAILPDGVVVRSSGPLTGEASESDLARGYLTARLSGPTGPGTLSLSLSPTGVDAEPSPSPAADRSVVAGTSVPSGFSVHCPATLASRAECEELLAPDGTVIGHRSSITSGEAKVLAVLLRRDGGQIYAAADNNMHADQPALLGRPPRSPSTSWRTSSATTPG
jgi:hypothetical protein